MTNATAVAADAIAETKSPGPRNVSFNSSRLIPSPAANAYDDNTRLELPAEPPVFTTDTLTVTGDADVFVKRAEAIFTQCADAAVYCVVSVAASCCATKTAGTASVESIKLVAVMSVSFYPRAMANAIARPVAVVNAVPAAALAEASASVVE